MHKLPNLFPYFERKETKKYVRLGVIHTLLYGIYMMLFLILCSSKFGCGGHFFDKLRSGGFFFEKRVHGRFGVSWGGKFAARTCSWVSWAPLWKAFSVNK